MTYSSARCSLRRGQRSETAQRRKIDALLDRLDLKPGQRLLEIGCGWGSLAIEAAHARRAGRRPDPVDRAEGLGRARIAEAGLVRPHRDPPAGLSRHRRAVRRRRLGRDGRGGRPALVARLSRLHRPQPEAGRPRGAPVHRHATTHLFDGYARNADFIQTYIFPGGMLIDEPRFARLAERARPQLAGPQPRLRPRLCRDAEALAATATTQRSRRGPLPGLRPSVPPAVALLSDVLRRRLPRRRDRRRAGDAGQGLTAARIQSSRGGERSIRLERKPRR